MPGKGRPPQAIPSSISRHIITCYVRYQGSKHTVIKLQESRTELAKNTLYLGINKRWPQEWESQKWLSHFIATFQPVQNWFFWQNRHWNRWFKMDMSRYAKISSTLCKGLADSLYNELSIFIWQQVQKIVTWAIHQHETRVNICVLRRFIKHMLIFVYVHWW